jgi:hypothetical protein
MAGDSGNEGFYNNRELYEMIMPEINQLKTELKETRSIIKKYNGLRKRICDIEEEVQVERGKNEGKDDLLLKLKDWSGWIVAVITLIVYLIENGVI